MYTNCQEEADNIIPMSVLYLIGKIKRAEVAFLKPKSSGLLLKKVENNEQTQCHVSDDGKRLCDHDVTRL